jgi:hypothetical protein
MNRKTREERLKQAQRIVARYAPKNRDLVAELIAERRAEAAAECSEVAWAQADLVAFDRPMQHQGDEVSASDDKNAQAAAQSQTKSEGGDR